MSACPMFCFDVRERRGAEGAGDPAGCAFDWPSERKLRLFACGCCRRAWHRLAPPCRRAVRVAERYADGRAGVNELENAWRACRAFERRGQPAPIRDERSEFRYYLMTEFVHLVAGPVLTPVDARTVGADLRPWRGDSIENDQIDRAHDRLAEDVFGAPRRPSTFAPGWRTVEVLTMVRTVYRERRFDALPELAGLLERAGCDDTELLAHCRSSAEHTRGCWAVDRVLGRG